MTEHELHKLRFPIGEFIYPKEISLDQRANWIQSISDFTTTVMSLTSDLSTPELNLTYRPEGWNIKQVVHHCADSHMNAVIRFKLTLTEDSPIIRPYFEERWADLSDGNEDDLGDSLQLLTALHSKWSRLLRGLTEEDLSRSYVHPQYGKQFSLLEAIGLYAWHCEHHLGHIRLALKSN